MGGGETGNSSAPKAIENPAAPTRMKTKRKSDLGMGLNQNKTNTILTTKFGNCNLFSYCPPGGTSSFSLSILLTKGGPHPKVENINREEEKGGTIRSTPSDPPGRIGSCLGASLRVFPQGRAPRSKRPGKRGK
jgi:hypothetical protein